MASRRFASSMTLSAGAKMNSASLSTNFLMSHGQATRSTFTRSRVIHFMAYLLLRRLESISVVKTGGKAAFQMIAALPSEQDCRLRQPLGYPRLEAVPCYFG